MLFRVRVYYALSLRLRLNPRWKSEARRSFGTASMCIRSIAGVSVLADVGGQLAVYREDLRVASTCE
jgi:hypothetical protein